MTDQHIPSTTEAVLSPTQKHKYTALLQEVRDLRAALKESRELVSELEHELEALRPSAKCEESLQEKLTAFLGEHFDAFSKTERHLLKLFLKKSPNLVRHAEVMNWLYSSQANPPMDKIRDVYVSKLRGKFRSLGIPATLVTVWGEGWKLVHGVGVTPGARTFMLKSHREAPRAAHSISDIEGQASAYDLPRSWQGKRHTPRNSAKKSPE